MGAGTVEVPAGTDTFECIGPGPWQRYVEITCGKHVIPVVALELRLVSELVRSRPDRYLPLMEHMRSHGADVALVRKAMSDRGVGPVLRQQVMDSLRGE